MRSRSIVLATVGLLAAAGGATACTGAAATEETPAAAAPTEADIRALFDTWNTALASGDAEEVADLYAPDAVLLATLSAEVKDSPEEIEHYFEASFLPKSPQGVVTESHVAVLDTENAVHSGLYDFTLTDPATGAGSVVPARFTYVYERIDGEWLITSHHSSVQPAS